ncbi:RNA polymerase sigma factor [Pseudocolwellia agarivorans]|uniref:RNA polymerase sigma factor n=1 Tax=Pseudocolwellia agarivorans TaxID=1911682 RepID=UPI000985FBC8|nr:sigma-70 family RNA polymerase sigma factor [Pseudocolwellia agarivorans]
MDISSYIDQLYREHGKELNRLVRRIFGIGPPDPEDLVQEAFSNMLLNKNIQNIEHPKAYLVRSAINLGRNYQSKHHSKIQDFIDDALQSVDESISPEGSPEDIYSLDERVKSVTTAIDKLTHKQKDIVVRSRIHGETYEQIKQSTGWSLADISRQLKDALRTLASDHHHEN